MRIDVVTIFPDYLAPLDLSLPGRARASGLIDVRVHDLRAWTSDRHRTVDDTPYGGGAGMVMRPQPWGEALDELIPDGVQPPTLVVPSPAGTPFTQATARRLAVLPWLTFACGRYEGIDQRVVDHAATRMPVSELSIGDYVVNGGEVAALVIIEAVVRLLPGFMGNPGSLDVESHGTGTGETLLEHPVYTKPASWRGQDVPEVLLSGHHGQIEQWRREQSLLRTAQRRPDLLPRDLPRDG
jgi:tRNA (guanine37-N1)-methyltransferase